MLAVKTPPNMYSAKASAAPVPNETIGITISMCGKGEFDASDLCLSIGEARDADGTSTVHCNGAERSRCMTMASAPCRTASVMELYTFVCRGWRIARRCSLFRRGRGSDAAVRRHSTIGRDNAVSLAGHPMMISSARSPVRPTPPVSFRRTRQQSGRSMSPFRDRRQLQGEDLEKFARIHYLLHRREAKARDIYGASDW